MALEALDCLPWQASPIAREAAEALRQALAQPEQEPVKLSWADIGVTSLPLRPLEMEMNDPAVTYCHRFAILMECVMLGGADKYWDEMGTLLDEYHKARDAWAEAHGQPYVSGFGKD